MRRLVALVFLIAAIGCESDSNKVKVETSVEPESYSDRQLVDQHYNAVLWFSRSAEMKVLFEQIYSHAAIKLELNRALSEGNPAVVLDLDETVLDNSPYEVECIRSGEPYTSATWKEWTARGEAPILPGAFNFLTLADSLGVEVFYISNRKVDELEGTLKNLKQLGVPNADEEHVLLRTETSDKSPRRAIVEAEYDVILYLGDNLTDYSQRLAERDSADLGLQAVNELRHELSGRFILFPNPMYGEWEKAIYGNTYRLSSEEKLAKREEILFGK